MILSIVGDLAGLSLGVAIFSFVIIGVYVLAKKLWDIRQEDPDYETRIEGTEEYPFSLDSNEEVLFDSRGRDIGWKLIMIVGFLITFFSVISIIFIFLAYWGFSLMVYAYDRKNDADYVFTTNRLIQIDSEGKLLEYDYNEVQQLQKGTAGYEKIINAGHLEFSTGEKHQLHRIPAVRNPSKIANRLEAGITAQQS